MQGVIIINKIRKRGFIRKIKGLQENGRVIQRGETEDIVAGIVIVSDD